jgi:chromosome segregation ATPase
METSTNGNVQKESSNKGKGLIFLLIGLVAALSALSGYFYVQVNGLKAEAQKLKDQQEQSNKDIDEYRAQLQELTAKYDSLMQAHEGLRGELKQEQEKVIALMRDYERLKATGGSTESSGGKNLRARLEELQQAYDENEAIILDLKAKNQELTDENFKASKKVEELNAQNTKLTDENGKLSKTVDVAKRLKTYEVYADAVRLSSDKTKEKPTTKASKADRIRVCFTILDNQIADKQEKILYAVIKDPDGKIFANGDRSNITLLNGNEISYSVKKEIFYDNKVMQLCMNWDVVSEEKLIAGEYQVEIYAEGVQIGKSSFELK